MGLRHDPMKAFVDNRFRQCLHLRVLHRQLPSAADEGIWRHSRQLAVHSAAWEQPQTAWYSLALRVLPVPLASQPSTRTPATAHKS